MRSLLVSFFQKHGIISAIFFIISLVIINFCLYFFNREIFFTNIEIKEQAISVERKLDYVWSRVQVADVGIRGYLLMPSPKVAQPLEDAVRDYPRALRELEELLAAQQFDLTSFAGFKKQYVAKMNEAMKMKQLVDENRKDEALDILGQDNGSVLWLSYVPVRNNILAFENQLKANATYDYEQSMNNMLILQVLLLVLSIPALFMVVFRIRLYSRQRNELFKNLDQNNRKYIFQAHEQTGEPIEEESVIQGLIVNLQKASQFIKSITQGNYDVQWVGIDQSNQHLNTQNLAGDLIQMREQMKKVKEEDNQRLWANEGTARFADLLRVHDKSFEEKIQFFLSELVKYVHANQGALFMMGDDQGDEKVLEMTACYAYGKNKYLQKSIYAGEGLVGQAYQEKDIIMLTDIPSDYIEITSGLGQALPKCVLIIPLVYNEQVVGVLELASFQVFKDHEVEFMTKLLESLAATVVAAGINERTKELLEESQQRAEEMQAQEEEMRQNMEELSATQEEMYRKEQEYLSIIASLTRQVEEKHS